MDKVKCVVGKGTTYRSDGIPPPCLGLSVTKKIRNKNIE